MKRKLIKKEMNFAQILRTIFYTILILCACFGMTARAQTPGTVIPFVCFEPKPETFTLTLTGSITPQSSFLSVSQVLPVGVYTFVINPGGATEENFPRGVVNGNAGGAGVFLNGGFGGGGPFAFNHAAGETVLMTTHGDAVFSYHNTSSSAVTIPKNVPSGNFFAPGPLVYSEQTNIFQPGRHEKVFSIKAIAGVSFSWFLNGGQATVEGSAAYGCRAITYQGRLSDAGNAANGQYDLQFQAFDSETGGAAQSDIIKIENVQVTNGIFTVPLAFYSSFANNFKANYLEIGVRSGIATGNDPFTTLAPRQPITSVPYAINATNAKNATAATNGFTIVEGTLNLNDNMLRLRQASDINHGLLWSSAVDGIEFRGYSGFIWKNGTNGATERMRLDGSGNLTVTGNLTVNGTINGSSGNNNFIQNTTQQQANSNFNVSGDGVIGGNLTVGGTINGTVTNATNATNALQLGGVPAANYLTNASNFGQSATTVSGTDNLNLTNATTGYLLVPGLTQTVNVPANSSLLISTDGGILSQGAINTFSVIDAAIFVDSSLISARRIVVSNSALPASVENWALSHAQTLSVGSHTIEVRVRYSGGQPTFVSASSSDPLLRGTLTVAVIKN